MENLGLPDVMFDFPTYQRGIVLVTGETGSGKSTTMASIVDKINHTRRDHIITLEDPIEYVYTPDKCSIDQREIGKDTKSFASGLRASLRQDPDVILVGEMRDLDTIETALTAAETGHLVFGTLHTKSAAESVDRLVDVFPEGRQRQIRLQLSMTLMAVVSQQLLPRADGKGSVVACEVMIVNPTIRSLIREGKTPQIENTLATTAELGSITMDNMLVQMVRNHVISREVAIEAARDSEYVKRSAR
jgi:twitching motility protein PilT